MPIVFYSLLFLLISFSSFGATWKKIAGNPVVQSCPTGYILVPASAPVTRDFCVMKYEAKNDGYGTPVSVATSVVWATIDRPTARAKCQSLGYGYDLISNNEWQAIAKNITTVVSNWSTGTLGWNEINRGHSDGTPASVLVASADDNFPCTGTGQGCSSTAWDSQRRTHKLSNGNFIWDFAGNVWEWVLMDNKTSNGADSYVSLIITQDRRQTSFGYPLVCFNYSTSPYCGFGYGYYNYAVGGLIRGGSYSNGLMAGIYAANFSYDVTYTAANVGFRCTYTP